MSSFTKPLAVRAVPKRPIGWRRILPPGWHRPTWEVAERFEYAVGSLERPTIIYSVREGFRFDGASVPLLLRVFVPMAHPNYMQATALHDWMLVHLPPVARRFTDSVFFEALGVLGMPKPWQWALYLAVCLATIRSQLRHRKNASGAKSDTGMEGPTKTTRDKIDPR